MNRHTVLHVCLLLVTWSGKSHASQEPGPSSTERNLVAGRTTTYRSTSSSPKIVLNTGENVQPTSYRYQLFVGKSARVLSELENAFATRTLYSNSTQALRDGLFAQLSLSPTEDTAEGPENTSSGKKIEFVVPLTRDAASKLISTEVHESCRISEQYLTRCVPPNYVYRTVPKEALEAKRQKKVSEAKAQSACSTLWTVVDRPCPLLRSSTGVDRPTPHGESVEPHEVAVRLYFPLATDFSQISELDQKCLLHREDEYQNDLIFHPDLTLPVYYAFGWYRIGVEEAFMMYHRMASDEKSFQHVSVGQLFNVTATMQPRKEDVAGDEKFLQSGLYHRQLSEYLRRWTQRQSVQDPTPWEYRRCDQDANVGVIRSSSAATTPQSPQQEHPWSAHSGFGQDDRETRESQPSEKNHVLYTSFESGCFALGNEDNSGVQMSESESVTKRRSLFVSPLQELQTAFYPIGTASLFTSDKLIPSDAHTILYITGFFVWAALMDLKRESRSANLYLTMFSADGIVMSLHVFELLDSKTRSFNDTTCFTRADETVTCPFLYMVEVLPGTASAQMTYEIIVTLSTTLHATGPSADASRLVAFLQDVVATLYRIPIHVPKHIDQTSEPSNQPIRNHVGDKREGLRGVLFCLAALMVVVGVVAWLRRNQDSTADNDDKMSRLREVDTEGHREDGMDDAPHSLNMLPGVRCPSTPPPALSVNLPPEK